MDILSIIGLILVLCVIWMTVKEYLPEYSVLIGIASGILIFGLILSQVAPAISEVEKLFCTAKIPKEYSNILFKCLGICLISQFACDICQDCGSKALSSKVELAGKAAILLCSLPLFQKIMEMAIKLMG